MVFLLSKRKNLLLFGIGFLIGIALEILLLQTGWFHDLYAFISPSDLHKNQRVACLVMVNNAETLEAASRTWMRDCDEFVAVRVRRNDPVKDEEESCGRTPVLNVTTGSAWGGLCIALRRIGSRSDCDWFAISPDNVMVLVDNLKKFVGSFNQDEEHYLGHAIGHYEGDYNALEAGVVISRGTMRKLIERFNTEDECEKSGKYWRNEDIYLGKYLKQLGIYPEDTRDEEGRGRFLGYSINVLLNPGKLYKQSDYNKKALYPSPQGVNCCSHNLVTIDATNSIRMYHHYYYLYKLDRGGQSSKAPESSNDFDWREFLRGEGYNESAIENMSPDEYYQVWASKIPPESLYEMMRKEFGS